MTIAYVFPGQGSQKVGMCKDLFDEYQLVRDMFKEVNDILGKNLSQIIFEGPIDSLTLTENTQPALMLCSVAVARVLEKISNKKIQETGKFIAGHSLGEFSALTTANSLALADTAKILQIRGQAMQNAVATGKGAMFALLGANYDKATEICNLASKFGICEIANDNSVGQLVLSGEANAIEEAIKISSSQGFKAIKLNVSAPFHCSMMIPAQQELKQALSNIEIKQPRLTLIANVTANIENNPNEIRNNLVTQVTATVRWTESVNKMIELGVTHFVEVGPGKVLSGLIKRINPNVQITSLQTLEDLNNYVTVC
jgi:[acyl-carrier-protein] S-malonyltransferase